MSTIVKFNGPTVAISTPLLSGDFDVKDNGDTIEGQDGNDEDRVWRWKWSDDFGAEVYVADTPPVPGSVIVPGGDGDNGPVVTTMGQTYSQGSYSTST